MLSSGSFVKKHSANAPKDDSLCITLINSRVRLVWINLREPPVKVANSSIPVADPRLILTWVKQLIKKK